MSEAREWYFQGADGATDGPIGKDELLARRARGELTDATLVWTTGMEAWEPLASVLPPPAPAPPLAPPSAPPPQRLDAPLRSPYAPPEAARLEHTPAVGFPSQRGGDTHPWRRYFAKVLDVTVIGMVMIVILVFALAALVPNDVERIFTYLDNQIVAGIVMLGLWIPVEAALLSVVGTTPARWLFGIKVRGTDGHNLDFVTAAWRAALVSVQGMGLGIWLFALIAQVMAYRRLTSSGSTIWDDRVNAEVTHATWSAGRAIACWLTTIGIVALIVWLNIAGRTAG